MHLVHISLVNRKHHLQKSFGGQARAMLRVMPRNQGFTHTPSAGARSTMLRSALNLRSMLNMAYHIY
jgi:hypothetical protein